MALSGRGARDNSQPSHCTDPSGGWGARVTNGGGRRQTSHFVTRMSEACLVCSATPQAEIGYFFPESDLLRVFNGNANRENPRWIQVKMRHLQIDRARRQSASDGAGDAEGGRGARDKSQLSP